jgi:hypothetical protein
MANIVGTHLNVKKCHLHGTMRSFRGYWNEAIGMTMIKAGSSGLTGRGFEQAKLYVLINAQLTH